MRIEHVALWTDDLERLRAFYEQLLGARAGARYVNPHTGFASYFLELDAGARIELMQMPGIAPRDRARQDAGWIHVAVAVGSRADVDRLAAAAGPALLDGPRLTGDGYYEAVLADPDGNRIELTADA